MSDSHFAIIRAARLDDVARVTAIVSAAYMPYVARIGRRPAPMDADYAQAIEEGAVWLLEIDAHPVGLLVLRQKVDHLLIDNIAIDPQCQGTGKGSLMLRHAEQEALARGLLELRLYTNVAMTENLAFYQRRGFVETDRRTDDGYARVFFSKTLTPGT